MDYETLLAASDQAGLIVKEKPLQTHAGRICGNRIAIRDSLGTTVEKACATGVVNTLENNGDVGGSAGFMVAVIFIISGIVGIVTRNSRKKTGPIVCFVFYLLAGLLAISNSAVYSDLVSRNPRYADIPGDEDVRLFGKVVGKVEE